MHILRSSALALLLSASSIVALPAAAHAQQVDQSKEGEPSDQQTKQLIAFQEQDRCYRQAPGDHDSSQQQE